MDTTRSTTTVRLGLAALSRRALVAAAALLVVPGVEAGKRRPAPEAFAQARVVAPEADRLGDRAVFVTDLAVAWYYPNRGTVGGTAARAEVSADASARATNAALRVAVAEAVAARLASLPPNGVHIPPDRVAVVLL